MSKFLSLVKVSKSRFPVSRINRISLQFDPLLFWRFINEIRNPFYKKNMFRSGKLRIEHFGNDEFINEKLHKTSSNENILGKTTF